MEIKKVKWRKRIGQTIVLPHQEKDSFNWTTAPIDINTHGYGVREDDNATYYFTIKDKQKIDGKDKFIAVIDTFSPARKESSEMKLAIGDSVCIEEDEIKGTTTMKTS
ncbi:MAG: hypothetical protein ABSA46_21025 [Thermodesulfovibrionales bacterium]|jgi:hypothetical protein